MDDCLSQMDTSSDEAGVEAHLFKEVVAVQIKPLGRDAFQASLTVRLRPDDPAHPRSLLVEVTDEADLLFYHSLIIDEGDFHAIKADQRIRVDFQTFPSQVAELLRRCCATPDTEGVNSNSPADGGLRMLACLECSPAGESVLSIVEANQFRELTHIALKLRKGSDEVVKKHLAAKLKSSKSECAILHEKLQLTEQALAESRKHTEEFRARARVVAEEREHLEQTMKANHQRELAELRAEQARILADRQRAAEADRKRIEDELRNSLDQAQVRAERSERTVEELQQQRHSLTTSKLFLQERFDVGEAQVQTFRTELQDLREQTKELELVKFQQERQIGEMRVQQAALQEQVSSKGALVTSQAAQAEASNSQRKGIEEMLAASKQQVRSLEEKLTVSVQEITKGNEIIQSLHGAAKQAKAKLKTKANALGHQDKAVADLEKAAELNKRALEEQRQEIAQGKERENKFQKDAQDLRKQMADCHEVLKSNQEVIEYLNRQLTERELKTIPMIGRQDAAATIGHVPPMPSTGNRSSSLAELLRKAEGAGRGLAWNTSEGGSLSTNIGATGSSALAPGMAFSPEVGAGSTASTALPGVNPGTTASSLVASYGGVCRGGPGTPNPRLPGAGIVPRSLAFSPEPKTNTFNYAFSATGLAAAYSPVRAANIQDYTEPIGAFKGHVGTGILSSQQCSAVASAVFAEGNTKSASDPDHLLGPISYRRPGGILAEAAKVGA